MNLSRRHFFFGSLALPLAAQKKKPHLELARPNLLLVLVDGLPAWMTGCYGNHEVSTPNIDRLCRMGTRFLNAFVPAGAPAPSRNAYFTGKVYRAPDPAPAQSLLHQALGTEGFECNLIAGQEMSAATAAAVQFIDKAGAGKPFALTLVYSGIEPPYEAPRQFLDLYSGQRFENWPSEPPARQAARGKEMFGARVENLRNVAACVSAIDAEFAKVLAKVYARQFTNETLIVFASTSGALFGYHGLWDGSDASDPPNLYDQVVNVPLIWTFPSRVPPSITQVELVSAYDLLPTICEFMLVPPPSGAFPGRSYLPLATAKPFPRKQPWKPAVFGHYKNTEMARVDRYKVIVRDEGKGPGELYDLRVDREESQNQYDNPQFLDVRDSLSGQLANWRKLLV